MRCDEVMKTEVEYVLPEDSVQEAARKMREANVGFLPVCDRNKNVLGTVTDRDIAIRLVAENRPATTPVREVMTQQVVACSPTDKLQHAEELMMKHHKSRIMCIEAGRLIGVISLSDIAERDTRRAARTLQQVAEREVHA